MKTRIEVLHWWQQSCLDYDFHSCSISGPPWINANFFHLHCCLMRSIYKFITIVPNYQGQLNAAINFVNTVTMVNQLPRTFTTMNLASGS